MNAGLASKKSNSFVYLLLLLISFSMAFQFDYLFGGANRYVSLRVIIALIPVYFLYVMLCLGGIKRESIYIFSAGLILPIFHVFTWVDFFSPDLFFRTLLNYVYVFSLLAIFYDGLYRIDFDRRRRIILYSVVLMILALSIECYFRFNYPALDLNDELLAQRITTWTGDSGWDFIFSYNFFNYKFYAYKYSSIMFFDSNYVGLFSVFLSIVILYYMRTYSFGLFALFLFIAASLFVFLSFSRASIVAYLIVIYIEFFRVLIKKRWLILLSLLVVASAVIFSYGLNILTQLLDDGSFKTKLDIWASISENFAWINLYQFLFGFGSIEGGYVYSYEEGKYAHALIPLLLGESGFFGLIIYLFLIIFLFQKGGIYGMYFLIVIFLNGFSLIDPWQILIFWAGIFMYVGSSSKDLAIYNGLSRF